MQYDWRPSCAAACLLCLLSIAKSSLTRNSCILDDDEYVLI